MKVGDIAWNHIREGSRLVTLLEVRYMNGNPEWVQVLDGGGTRWTAAALIEVIDAAG
jgi:hypothetical protein